MQDHDPSAEERPLVSTRTMDIVAALLFLVASGIVIYDASRLGFRWLEGEGPASGYFPFYVALIMAGASLVNLIRAILRLEPGGEGVFVSVPAFGRVLAVLIPLSVYVVLVSGISNGPLEVPRFGIYLASALFIFVFMLAIGRESPLKAILVALAVPVVLFVMFEKEFLIPLPRCQAGLCEGLEERLIGVPYDAAKGFLLGLFR
jgi:hypothetical protein